jgi:hypothetical protein
VNAQADSETEEQWIASQRQQVIDYLRGEQVEHLGVGESPAFHVHPYLALWAVQSRRSPGAVGWWALSGDVPTDYISSSEARHPREALRAFARQWHDWSAHMLRGETHPDYRLTAGEESPELGDLLRRRAELLERFADDEEVWSDTTA